MERSARHWKFDAEARQCRKLAAEFGGRPEKSLLLNIADCFEAMSVNTLCPPERTAPEGAPR